MEFLTQGTVQVELTPSGTSIKIRINPVQDFSVKHGGNDYIVFMPDSTTAPLDAKAFEKTEAFEADIADPVLRVLTDAALKSIKIEIKS